MCVSVYMLYESVIRLSLSVLTVLLMSSVTAPIDRLPLKSFSKSKSRTIHQTYNRPLIIRPLSPTDIHPASARSNAARARTAAMHAPLNAAVKEIMNTFPLPDQKRLADAVVSCIHTHAVERDWAPSQAAGVCRTDTDIHNISSHALAYPTLPLCASLYSDATGRTLLPFSCSVGADSYRATMLRDAATADNAKKDTNNALAPPLHSSSKKTVPLSTPSYASEPAVPLTASDLSLLGDALLCNSSLTSLSLDRSSLDSHALPPLCHMLQQHSSLTSISLAGNLLGLHPDTEQLRQLFHVLASPATLPHLSQLNLSANQFPPRSLEIFCTAFLRTAPSIQSVDWRENCVGLRGGWSIVDALRVREQQSQPPIALVTSFQIECDVGEEHVTAELVTQGSLPQPNLAQVTSSTRARPAYWPRLQQILKENRQAIDLALIRAEQNKQKEEEEQKQKLQKDEDQKESVAASAAHLPSVVVNALPSVDIDGSSSRSSGSIPSFLPPALFHSSLGNIVSELNLERSTRFEKQEQLRLALKKQKEMEEQILFQQKLLRQAEEKSEQQLTALTREIAHRKELEAALIAAKSRETSLIATHARQMASMNIRSDEALTEQSRLRAALTSVRGEAEEERTRHSRERQLTAELIAAREMAEGAHLIALRALEKRVEQFQWERAHLGLEKNEKDYKLTPAHIQSAAASHAAQSLAAAHIAQNALELKTTQGIAMAAAAGSSPFSTTSSSSSSAVPSPSSSAIPATTALPTATSLGGISNKLPLRSPVKQQSIHPSGVPLSAALSSPLSFAPYVGSNTNIAASATSPSTSTFPTGVLQLVPQPVGSPSPTPQHDTYLAAATAGTVTNTNAPKSPINRNNLTIVISKDLSAAAPGGSSFSLPAPISPSSSSYERSISPTASPTTPASPSITMFASGAPPLPASVLSPTHTLQLMPHHIATWQQPAPKPLTLKLKPKQRDV
jgi:hypothetical protein